MVDPPTALPFVESGRMKALAVASDRRSPALPNVPTLDELGIPNVHTSTWYGILAPAGTPKAIVDRLNKEINAVLKMPDIQARLLKNAAQSYDWSPRNSRSSRRVSSSATRSRARVRRRSRWTEVLISRRRPRRCGGR
jgi:tripartite-type tricarboxylate transporter receptor subunit TctC